MQANLMRVVGDNYLVRSRTTILAGWAPVPGGSGRWVYRESYVRRDQAETSVLFELIAERYERKSIALTANTPFSQWGEVFVDTAMTLAAVDRLVHHSTILEMNVDSYRRRVAQAAQPSARPTRAKTNAHAGA